MKDEKVNPYSSRIDSSLFHHLRQEYVSLSPVTSSSDGNISL